MIIIKRNILICLLLILMVTFAVAENRFYRTRSDIYDYEFRAQLDKLFVQFMKVGECSLKATNGRIHPGIGQKLFINVINILPINRGYIGKLKEEYRTYQLILDYTIELYIEDVDVERSEGMRRYVRPVFPKIGHPWISGRDLVALARWFSYNRSGEFINKKKSAVYYQKDMEDYYDEMMLNNLEWFRDNKGKLHIPDFLIEKYNKKYPTIKNGL